VKEREPSMFPVRYLAVLSLALAVALPAAAQSLPATLTCNGQEPFWSLTFTGDRAKLDAANPEIAALGPDIAGKRSVIGGTSQPVLHWRGKSRNGTGDIVAWVRRAACVMPSGDSVPFQMLLSLPGTGPVMGCCQ